LKKKVLMGLILLTMIGVGMVSAQDEVKLEDVFKFTKVAGGYSVAGLGPT
jgi:hypothetical protein